MLFQRKP